MSSTMKVALLFTILVGITTQFDCDFSQTTFSIPAKEDGVVQVADCATYKCCEDEHCVGMIYPEGETEFGACIFGKPTFIDEGAKGSIYLKDLAVIPNGRARGQFKNRQTQIIANMAKFQCKDILQS